MKHIEAHIPITKKCNHQAPIYLQTMARTDTRTAAKAGLLLLFLYLLHMKYDMTNGNFGKQVISEETIKNN